MQLLTGQASSIRSTVTVSGGGRDSAVSTKHVVLLKVNGRQAMIESDTPPMIEDGEIVVLAGVEQSGAFQALAYMNKSTGVSGDAGLSGSQISTAIGLAGGVFALVAFSDSFFGVFSKLLALAFFGFGAYHIYEASRISSAVSMVSREA